MTHAEADNAVAALAARAARALTELCSETLAPGLYLVATPIGNLGDVTLRALAVILRASRVYCEDTRHSRKLLSAYGIGRKLLSYHEHNAGEVRPVVLAALAAGESVALISDAGTPLVADPGYKLALAAVEQGARVYPIPGASAVTSALVASGLPTDSFYFGGFLPAKQAARRTRLEEVKAVPGTLIFFETANRLENALADVADLLGDRPAALLRELTKRHEQLVRGPVSTLWRQLGEEERRGEMVLLLAEAVKQKTATSDLVWMLKEEMVKASLKDAVAAVASRTGAPRKVVYDTALRVRDRDDA